MSITATDRNRIKVQLITLSPGEWLQIPCSERNILYSSMAYKENKILCKKYGKVLFRNDKDQLILYLVVKNEVLAPIVKHITVFCENAVCLPPGTFIYCSEPPCLNYNFETGTLNVSNLETGCFYTLSAVGPKNELITYIIQRFRVTFTQLIDSYFSNNSLFPTSPSNVICVPRDMDLGEAIAYVGNNGPQNTTICVDSNYVYTKSITISSTNNNSNGLTIISCGATIAPNVPSPNGVIYITSPITPLRIIGFKIIPYAETDTAVNVSVATGEYPVLLFKDNIITTGPSSYYAYGLLFGTVTIAKIENNNIYGAINGIYDNHSNQYQVFDIRNNIITSNSPNSVSNGHCIYIGATYLHIHGNKLISNNQILYIFYCFGEISGNCFTSNFTEIVRLFDSVLTVSCNMIVGENNIGISTSSTPVAIFNNTFTNCARDVSYDYLPPKFIFCNKCSNGSCGTCLSNPPP